MKRYICWVWIFYISVPEIKSAASLGKLPDGLTLIEDFVTEEEEERLLACVRWEEMSDHLGKYLNTTYYTFLIYLYIWEQVLWCLWNYSNWCEKVPVKKNKNFDSCEFISFSLP